MESEGNILCYRIVQGSLWAGALCKVLSGRWAVRLRLRGRHSATLADDGGQDVRSVEVRGGSPARRRTQQLPTWGRRQLKPNQSTKSISYATFPHAAFDPYLVCIWWSTRVEESLANSGLCVIQSVLSNRVGFNFSYQNTSDLFVLLKLVSAASVKRTFSRLIN